MATNAPGVPNESIAAWPASWTGLSIVSVRLSPAFGGTSLRTPPVGFPWASTWTLVLPLVPRSTLS
jgi:hypothetical protein